jgi:hypothetical protein
MPAKGEQLVIGDIDQFDIDPGFKTAVKQLAAAKAPETIAQLAIWNLGARVDWPALATISRSWANPNERALARQFVERHDVSGARDTKLAGALDSGMLFIDIPTGDAANEVLRQPLGRHTVLGLSVHFDFPERPTGPSLACRVRLVGSELSTQVNVSSGSGASWVSAGKFSIPVRSSSSESVAREADVVADAWAEKLLERLVRVRLTKAARAHDKDTYVIRVENDSPLILNGLTLSGVSCDVSQTSTLAGFSLPPRKSLTVPASAEMVQRLGLRAGILLRAANLSGL